MAGATDSGIELDWHQHGAVARSARCEVPQVGDQPRFDLGGPARRVQRFSPGRDVVARGVIMAIAQRSDRDSHVKTDLQHGDERKPTHVRPQIRRAVRPQPVGTSPSQRIVEKDDRITAILQENKADRPPCGIETLQSAKLVGRADKRAVAEFRTPCRAIRITAVLHHPPHLAEEWRAGPECALKRVAKHIQKRDSFLRQERAEAEAMQIEARPLCCGKGCPRMVAFPPAARHGPVGKTANP